jgi:hypothetical protein
VFDFGDLVEEVDLLVVGELIACVLGHIERRNDGIGQFKNSFPLRHNSIFQESYFLSFILLLIEIVVDGGHIVDESVDG